METGLVIRTAFNNQGWAGHCNNPRHDNSCFKCRDGELFINHRNPIGEDINGFCKGESEGYPLSGYIFNAGSFWCWEQVLCKSYFWGNVRGKWRKVSKGMPVYFVYTEPDGTLTLWGHSSVTEKPHNELKQYSPIYFKPFEPMPQDKWRKGLSGEIITGSSWRQGNFRYLNEAYEKKLADLVEGKEPTEPKNKSLDRNEDLSIELNRDIKETLNKIANNEGREVNELIREAVAKLIRERRL